ncbi:MAG: nicotinamide riboside transporter PnuC [Clostridium sp.]|uniref:nicotinamide riboside transporter PnuC n=1 Tax=Clostridium sp. TaxID=1506 RepID=UPI003F38C102
MKFFKEFSPFQKGFFVVFLVASIVAFFIPIMTGTGTWAQTFEFASIVGIISTISGIFTAIYQAKASIKCYFWWTLNTITYAVVAWYSQLYGQVIQNIVFILPLIVVGFIEWRKNLSQNDSDEIEIKRFKAKHWIFTIIFIFVGWFLYGWFLKSLPDILSHIGLTLAPDKEYILDSLTTVFTIYAVFLTSKRYMEQWYFWILSNLGIVLFIESMLRTGFTVSDFSGALTWLQYGIIAFYGFYNWNKLYKKRKKA